MTEDGQPYGPQRYKDIVRERFLISQHTHTSYSDTAGITPAERGYILEFIVEDLENKKKMREKAEEKARAKKNS